MMLGKNYGIIVIRQNIVVSFPQAVHDNIVYNDVTIMSPLHSDVITLGKKFLFCY